MVTKLIIMANKKKNGELDMRYKSSKEKAKKRHMWEVIIAIIVIVLILICGL